MRESVTSPIDQHLLATILDSNPDAIVATTPAGIVTSWNQAAARIFGYAPEEMLGRPIERIVPLHRRAHRSPCSQSCSPRLAAPSLSKQTDWPRTARSSRSG